MGGPSVNKPELVINGKRVDGREFNELRKIKITASPLVNASGSAYIEWGNNKILAGVYGPREVNPRHLADSTKAVLKCRYSMATFSSLSEHGRSGPNRRATEISKVIKEVFENVIMLNEYPDSQIDLFIEVLQADGGTRTAGITAAAVALATSGIPMRDLVYAVSVGRIGERLAIDFNMIEDNYSDSDMPIAIAPRNGEVLLLQMDGEMTKAQVSEAMDMAIGAGKTISAIQREALREAYALMPGNTDKQ
jgi:exosome complex component RRP41